MASKYHQDVAQSGALGYIALDCYDYSQQQHEQFSQEQELVSQHEQVVVQQHEPVQHWSLAEVVATLAKAKPTTSIADVTNLRIGIHLLSWLTMRLAIRII